MRCVKLAEDKSLFQRVQAVLAQSQFVQADISQVTPDTAMMADLNMSSLSLVMFACDLETEFNMEFPDENFHELVTLGDICAFLLRRLAP